MIDSAKYLFIRIVKFSFLMGVVNYILGYIKPYIQMAIYHAIVGPKILFGSFLNQTTLSFLSIIIGIYFLYQFIKFIRKNF